MKKSELKKKIEELEARVRFLEEDREENNAILFHNLLNPAANKYTKQEVVFVKAACGSIFHFDYLGIPTENAEEILHEIESNYREKFGDEQNEKERT